MQAKEMFHVSLISYGINVHRWQKEANVFLYFVLRFNEAIRMIKPTYKKEAWKMEKKYKTFSTSLIHTSELF